MANLKRDSSGNYIVLFRLSGGGSAWVRRILGSPIIRHLLDHLSFLDRTDYEAPRGLDRMVSAYSARLTTLSPDECNRLRRSLLRLKGGWNFEWIIRCLRKPVHCDPAIYVQLIRTQPMREKLVASGFGAHYLDVKATKANPAPRARRRGR